MMRQGLSEGADALLSTAVGAGDVPGVVAGLTTPEETIFEAAHGLRAQGSIEPMRADTVMWLASMTKPIVSAAAMQLVEQGRIGLDAPAANIIPELGQVRVLEGWDVDGRPRTRAAKGAITLRHLLTHTAGFTYDVWNADMARYHKTLNLPRVGSGQERALRLPLCFDPGERWEYGISIDWAGKMVEAASGMRLGAYLERNLTGPLGMSSTAFKITPAMRARIAKVHQRSEDGTFALSPFEVPQEPEFEPGGGGLYSSAQDYQRFMRMILNGGKGNGNQVLRRETVELMSRNAMGELRVAMLPSQNPLLSRDAEFFPGVPKTWSTAFMINEAAAPAGRSAGSLSWAGLANTYFWIDPAKRIGGVLMTQVWPFVDPRALALFTAYEKSVYSALV